MQLGVQNKDDGSFYMDLKDYLIFFDYTYI